MGRTSFNQCLLRIGNVAGPTLQLPRPWIAGGGRKVARQTHGKAQQCESRYLSPTTRKVRQCLHDEGAIVAPHPEKTRFDNFPIHETEKGAIPENTCGREGERLRAGVALCILQALGR